MSTWVGSEPVALDRCAGRSRGPCRTVASRRSLPQVTRLRSTFLLLALAFACAGANVREAPAAGEVGEIAFFSDRAGGGDLYVMNGDGTGTRRLTRGSAVRDSKFDPLSTIGLEAPQWSPGGSQILFASERGDVLFVVDVDSRRQRRLASNAVTADWSPDGKTIAFAKGRGDAVDLWVMRADGSQQRRLTKNGWWPDWSPDGKTIAFLRFRGGVAFEGVEDLWLMRADGSQQRRLTKNAWSPDWSPDGASVLFMKSGKGGPDIYLTRVRGGGERVLVRSGESPAWSPDGKQIAYVGEHGSSDIAVIGVDGTRQAWLTADSAGDSSPAWSPDGKRIAFANDLTFTREYLEGEEIFVMEIDGSGRRRLTDNKANDLAPAWKPAP